MAVAAEMGRRQRALEAEAKDRLRWIRDVKQRLGLVTIGERPKP
jgi:hypothetical protein